MGQDDGAGDYRTGESPPPNFIDASDKLIALRFKLIFLIEVWKLRHNSLFHNSPNPSYLKRGILRKLPRAFYLKGGVYVSVFIGLCSDFIGVNNPAPQYLTSIVEHDGLPRGYRLLWLGKMDIHGIIPEKEDSFCLF